MSARDMLMLARKELPWARLDCLRASCSAGVRGGRCAVSDWKLGEWERVRGGANMPSAGVESRRGWGTVLFTLLAWGGDGMGAEGGQKLGARGSSIEAGWVLNGDGWEGDRTFWLYGPAEGGRRVCTFCAENCCWDGACEGDPGP